MPNTLSRAMINALLPPGALWVPQNGNNLDLLLEGIGDCQEEIISSLMDLANTRDPFTTQVLPDLETEYGIRPNTNTSEDERRLGLNAAMTDHANDGSLDTLQQKLTQAGFTVSVYANTPAVNPTALIYQAFDTQFGRTDSQFGRSGAMFNYGVAGELLVNGSAFGDSGYFSVPEDSNYWPLFFFVGGDADRNGSTDALEKIESAAVPVSRRDEIKRLILRYKPMHSWCGLIVHFVSNVPGGGSIL